MKFKRLEKNIAKECAYIAVFVALTIAVQVTLAVLPSVEAVTLLFVAYAFVFGVKRSVIAGLAFAFIRQLVFGFFPSVLILYIVYYPLLAIVVGSLGRSGTPLAKFPFIIVCAVLLTATFTLLDDVITPLYYGFGWGQTKAYFYASLPFMTTQMINAGVTVAVGFLPLCRAFGIIKRNLS